MPFNAIVLLLLQVLFIATIACSPKSYVVEKTANPEYRPDTAFVHYEDISLSKFDSLKAKYQLDTIFGAEQDEFKRILLLRNWIRNHIAINDFGDPYPGADHPVGILDAALKGQGFHCGHYMVVQNAIMNAYGYVTRCLGSGPGGGPKDDGHHGMNEIWVNKYKKWFLSDAKFNHHFEKNGIPLSALEVRDNYLKNRAVDITLVKGPDRQVIVVDSLKDKSGKYIQRNKEWFAHWYTWIEWEKMNNRFTSWPEFDTKLNMYADDYFSGNTWYWDGKPHWAYNTEHMIPVMSRDAIEWTPNTIYSGVELDENDAVISLSSSTPNLKYYQVKEAPDGSWEQCGPVYKARLRNNRHEFLFRAVNKADVSGPVHRVVIRTKH